MSDAETKLRLSPLQATVLAVVLVGAGMAIGYSLDKTKDIPPGPIPTGIGKKDNDVVIIAVPKHGSPAKEFLVEHPVKTSTGGTVTIPSQVIVTVPDANKGPWILTLDQKLHIDPLNDALGAEADKNVCLRFANSDLFNALQQGLAYDVNFSIWFSKADSNVAFSAEDADVPFVANPTCDYPK